MRVHPLVLANPRNRTPFPSHLPNLNHVSIFLLTVRLSCSPLGLSVPTYLSHHHLTCTVVGLSTYVILSFFISLYCRTNHFIMYFKSFFFTKVFFTSPPPPGSCLSLFTFLFLWLLFSPSLLPSASLLLCLLRFFVCSLCLCGLLVRCCRVNRTEWRSVLQCCLNTQPQHHTWTQVHARLFWGLVRLRIEARCSSICFTPPSPHTVEAINRCGRFRPVVWWSPIPRLGPLDFPNSKELHSWGPFSCLSRLGNTSITFSRVRLPPTFLVVCLLTICVCLFSPPPNKPPKQHPTPHFPPHLIFHTCQARTSHHTPCQTPNLSLLFPPPSPTIHAPIWYRVRRVRRMGYLRFPVWSVRRRSLGSPQHSPWGVMRDSPDFPEPAALAANANPAARDAVKRATEIRAA